MDAYSAVGLTRGDEAGADPPEDAAESDEDTDADAESFEWSEEDNE